MNSFDCGFIEYIPKINKDDDKSYINSPFGIHEVNNHQFGIHDVKNSPFNVIREVKNYAQLIINKQCLKDNKSEKYIQDNCS